MRQLLLTSQQILFCLAALLSYGSLLPTSGFARDAISSESPMANEHIIRPHGPETTMRIVERFSNVIQTDHLITTVEGFDPEVLAISPIESGDKELVGKQIRVHAKKPGVTSIIITDEHNQIFKIEVFVEGDVRHLQAYIQMLFPESSVKAIKVRDSVVLRGWVSKPEHITEIVEIAEQFFPSVLNQMKLGGVNQVQLRVKVMEVQRSRIRQLGFNWSWLGEDAVISSTPGQLTPVTSLELPFGGPPSLEVGNVGDPTFLLGLTAGNSIFQGFLDALKQEGLLRILAEPTVTTTSGRPANLLAGGEFPILVPQALGTVSIEWREFGVRLEAVPIVLGGGNLRLEIAPEVSERDFANAVDINGFTVPGLTTRRVNTQVEMKFGQTLMIGGLISTRHTAETDKVPFLGELPWIGAAFRRVRSDENETELIIMVTPELIAPLDPDQVMHTGPGLSTEVPTDHELFFQGLLEVPVHGEPHTMYHHNMMAPEYSPGMMQPPMRMHGGSATPTPVPMEVQSAPADSARTIMNTAPFPPGAMNNAPLQHGAMNNAPLQHGAMGTAPLPPETPGQQPRGLSLPADQLPTDHPASDFDNGFEQQFENLPNLPQPPAAEFETGAGVSEVSWVPTSQANVPEFIEAPQALQDERWRRNTERLKQALKSDNGSGQSSTVAPVDGPGLIAPSSFQVRQPQTSAPDPR